ncbi:asparaginase [Trinickia dinghuensis]|uniref:Asparaginase n=1 Tax=Trinickia dinghuensis TaxID=2291023 RepID=A0A3D8JVU2_9BURK|nr:asparaginase [Trinickia dinghuensis]RDU97209.1 asparaginase [Trinickia dinghuensis]
MTIKRKVAVIGTGGTIAAVGRDAFDLIDYDANGQMLDTARLLALLPAVPADVDIVEIPFRTMSSTAVSFDEWRELTALCRALEVSAPDLAGIVISHGTATLEETAYFLQLTLDARIPVVLVGSQRPSNGLSSDAALNLYNAIRVAADPAAHDLGVLVVLNDEIHAARDVTKTSTYRLHAFQSRDAGALGCCDADGVTFYRRPVRIGPPRMAFDVSDLERLPLVGINYSYAGADGRMISGLADAGARGIVAAGFAPGCCTPAETKALRDAARAGIVVVMSTRAGSGRVGDGIELRENGFIAADNLNPQKARILLALALTRTDAAEEISTMFRIY